MPITLTPLRYPGGKSRLSEAVIELLRVNDLFYGDYVEPFAGGAGVAIRLLLDDYVWKIHLNDIDPAIYAFWHTVLNDVETIIAFIHDTPLTVDEWRRQVAIYKQANLGDISLSTLGCATLFLNRTNRSGILKGGLIGGLNQSGKYKMDCRFNRKNLIHKIQRIADRKDRIVLHSLDAIEYLEKVVTDIRKRSLINLDPPYYKKGGSLYRNAYDHEAHVSLSNQIKKMKHHWMLTYDDVPPVRLLYQTYRSTEYSLGYTAQVKKQGTEILFISEDLAAPYCNALKSRAINPWFNENYNLTQSHLGLSR